MTFGPGHPHIAPFAQAVRHGALAKTQRFSEGSPAGWFRPPCRSALVRSAWHWEKENEDQAFPGLGMIMNRHRNSVQQFAICINTDDPDLLTPRMIYEVLPDESAARSNYIRVIDNEGEDYLYPADYFVSVSFPEKVEQALLRVPHPISPATSAKRKQRAVPAHQRKVKPTAA